LIERTDVLVIGSGAAGLMFALEASRSLDVLVVTKGELQESNTRYAQGGIAAVLRLEDDYRQHVEDTLSAGAGLCDAEAVKVLVQEAPARIRDLIHWGVAFDLDKDSGLMFTREGGHRQSRILHVGDLTGKAIEDAMVDRVRASRRIDLREHEMLVDLIVEDGQCYGALLLRPDGWIRPVLARVTFLATGGAGQLYSRTTNPDIATGDGMAVCHRAGARLEGLEFVQFHPTAFAREGAPSFLISEALRGEGARLLDPNGKPFMERFHPMAELAPRDVVSRAIYEVMAEQQADHVLLDITHKSATELQKRFPFIYDSCLRHGVEMDRRPIPVSPAAHYICGGVKTDIDGRTSIGGLYASGEVAWTGVHGANRLASNSLLESVVFAYRAAVSADRAIHHLYASREPVLHSLAQRPWAPRFQQDPEPDAVLVARLRESLGRALWNHAGVVRHDEGLRQGLELLSVLEAQTAALLKRHAWTSRLLELRNLTLLGKLVLDAALARRHSVGCHYNADLPFWTPPQRPAAPSSSLAG
jgi:L-aspartate oxidase